MVRSARGHEVSFFRAVLQQAFQNGIDHLKDGKVAGVAKGGAVTIAGIFLANFLTSIDVRFASMEVSLRKINDNLSTLQATVPANLETTAWHTKELQRLARVMERQWERIVALEGAARGVGIYVPTPPPKPPLPIPAAEPAPKEKDK